MTTTKRRRAAPKPQPQRWQDCKPFIAALTRRGYLVDGRPVMSEGIYLYMFELYCDGRDS